MSWVSFGYSSIFKPWYDYCSIVYIWKRQEKSSIERRYLIASWNELEHFPSFDMCAYKNTAWAVPMIFNRGAVSDSCTYNIRQNGPIFLLRPWLVVHISGEAKRRLDIRRFSKNYDYYERRLKNIKAQNIWRTLNYFYVTNIKPTSHNWSEFKYFVLNFRISNAYFYFPLFIYLLHICIRLGYMKWTNHNYDLIFRKLYKFNNFFIGLEVAFQADRMSLFPSRRRIARDVHDRRPEEVLRGHEEDGEQEAHEGDTQTESKTPHWIASSEFELKISCEVACLRSFILAPEGNRGRTVRLPQIKRIL